MQKKKDPDINIESLQAEKNNSEISYDPTIIKNGVPEHLETEEKDRYREEHGDLTNDHT